MEFSHVTNTSYGGASGSADQFSADYGELTSIGEHLLELSKLMVATGYKGNAATEDYSEINPAITAPAIKNLQLYNVSLLHATDQRSKAGENLGIIGQALVDVAALYRDAERQVMDLSGSRTASTGAMVLTSSVEGFADGYYAKVEADQAEADRLQKEQDERDAAKKAEGDYMLGIVSSLCPGAAAWYQQMLNDAAIEEAIAYYEDPERGNNPALAAKLREEYEAMKKAREEAAKAGGEAGAFGDEAGSGDEASDWGSGFGGAGLDGGAGSDFGGGGGGFDLGDAGLETGWGSDDFASDLLDDNIDAEDYLDAASGLDDIASAGLDGAAAGVDAVNGDAEEAASGLWAQYGSQLSDMAQRYGVQAGLVLGGAAALYATREQTTEAVAHVAEFVTTKCRPAVNDVMEQVRGAAKQTHVKLANAKSGVTAAARGERAGDLIG